MLVKFIMKIINNCKKSIKMLSKFIVIIKLS